MGCVYLITNIVNGKQYVGKTTGTAENRWYNHIKVSEYRGNSHLNKAIRKYGEEAFTLSTLEEDDDEETLFSLEIHWIARLGTYVNGYNMTQGGEGKSGWCPSEETRRKMSASMKGKKNRKGIPFTENAKRRISVAVRKALIGKSSSMEGVFHTEETKRKISEANKGNRNRLGMTTSSETKAKLSVANIGFIALRWFEAVAAGTPAFVPDEWNLPIEMPKAIDAYGISMDIQFNPNILDTLLFRQQQLVEPMSFDPWIAMFKRELNR